GLARTPPGRAQRERGRPDQPRQFTRNLGIDDVETAGVTAVARTRSFRLRKALALSAVWGADTYIDHVRSTESLIYTDVQIESRLSRGQYLDGSTYVYGGAFADGEIDYRRRVWLRAGMRLAWSAA